MMAATHRMLDDDFAMLMKVCSRPRCLQFTLEAHVHAHCAGTNRQCQQSHHRRRNPMQVVWAGRVLPRPPCATQAVHLASQPPLRGQHVMRRAATLQRDVWAHEQLQRPQASETTNSVAELAVDATEHPGTAWAARPSQLRKADAAAVAAIACEETSECRVEHAWRHAENAVPVGHRDCAAGVHVRTAGTHTSSQRKAAQRSQRGDDSPWSARSASLAWSGRNTKQLFDRPSSDNGSASNAQVPPTSQHNGADMHENREQTQSAAQRINAAPGLRDLLSLVDSMQQVRVLVVAYTSSCV